MSEYMPRLTPGNKLGKYTIRRTISRGRLTGVYRALHPDLKRDVVIKLFYTGTRDGTDLDRCFEEDIRRVKALRHPNIIQIYDSGLTQNACYIVMELVEGTNLRDLISAHPTGLERDDLFRLFSQIASAVAYAHDQGIVHGNLKPDNVLLDVNKRPVLTDFNIPCLTEDAKSDATPAYMAPEQVNGISTPESDLYALGIMLYEMSTGDVPFKGTRETVLEQHIHANPIPPSQTRIGLDPRIERVILTALNKHPKARHMSAREMISAMEHQESVIAEYATLALDRNMAQAVRKSKSEIARFQRSRIADSEADTAQTTPIEHKRFPWLLLGIVGLVIVAAVIVLLFI
jgi:serine/threonine protein kinase